MSSSQPNQSPDEMPAPKGLEEYLQQLHVTEVSKEVPSALKEFTTPESPEPNSIAPSTGPASAGQNASKVLPQPPPRSSKIVIFT